MVSRMTRRGLIGLGAAAASCALAQSALASARLPLLRPGDHAAVATGATPSVAARELRLLNTHTGEKLKRVYWAEGRYEPEALKEIAHLMRDHRSDERHEIDPALLDALHAMRLKLDSGEDFHIISGYRSPATNAQMRENNAGVARKSYHMRGMAVDIRLPGRDLPRLRKVAVNIGFGGVGDYPRSDFLHVDVGPVRQWGSTRA
ncbi:MAG: DUF882 domain-containing protein [Parvibaculum sp.]|uniref:DUF882 domain-containing protein n=1 Tax=Parvibaculum sp. TaxID=2024848 RepID=UPI00271A9057|nr:DUF882 domain-containing protein [Parvibaculum sp.]MDO8838613.1 DUF882 domain-containing protein [Parvibaculum sp.]